MCQYRSVSNYEAPDLCPSSLLRSPVSAERANELARALKAIADPVRLRLLSLIASHADGEICVCDLTGAFDLSAPTISHHLKVLRESDIIIGERRGTWIYYRVRTEIFATLAEALLPASTEGGLAPA